MTILTIAAAVGSIAGSISSIIADTKNSNLLHEINLDRYADLAHFNELYLSNSNMQFLQFDRITHLLNQSRYNFEKQMQVFNNNLISNYIKECERETISLLTGGIPDSIDFIKDMSSLCNNVNRDPNFCSKIAISSDHIKFENVELDLDSNSGSLELKLIVLMPIMATNFPSDQPLKLYRVKNIGIHNSNFGFIKFDLPDLFLSRTIKDPFTGEYDHEVVEVNGCSRSVCQSRSLIFSERCACINSVLDGRSDFCSFKTNEDQSICDYILLDQSIMITARYAEFTPETDAFRKPVLTISNDTQIIEPNGQLVCHRGSLETIHHINHNNIEYLGSSKQKFEFMETEFNVTKINFLTSENEAFKNRIENLEKFNSEEYYQFRSNFVSKDTLLSWAIISSLLLIFFLFCVYVFYNFNKTKKSFLALLN